MGPLKYFVFNKKKDYQSGYLEHMDITERGIKLHTENIRQYGTFISRPMDSREEGNKWHRAVIRSTAYGDDSIRFYFYSSDSGQALVDGRLMDWDTVIRSSRLDLQKKHEIMRPFLVHEILNPRDILLYHARGRYLWIEIQLFCQAEFNPEILDMKIYAENRSFLQYLPEIYQTEDQNDFLGRYLSMFEAVYQDLDSKIRNAARQLDPRSAEPDFLQWMAEWVGITEIYLWPEEKLRILLNGIVRRNLIRGTREYMEYMIETFTGERPFVVEYSEIERYRNEPGVYANLKRYYAHGPYEVNILVREQAVPTLREQKALKKLIENMKPAHIEVHLVILRPYIYLNQNVYIGINSALGTYERASLSGMAGIPSVVNVMAGYGHQEE